MMCVDLESCASNLVTYEHILPMSHSLGSQTRQWGDSHLLPTFATPVFTSKATKLQVAARGNKYSNNYNYILYLEDITKIIWW